MRVRHSSWIIQRWRWLILLRTTLCTGATSRMSTASNLLSMAQSKVAPNTAHSPHAMPNTVIAPPWPTPPDASKAPNSDATPNTQKTGRSVLIQLLSWGIAIPVIFPVTALLTRYLGPVRYGEYTFTFPFLTVFGLLTCTGMDFTPHPAVESATTCRVEPNPQLCCWYTADIDCTEHWYSYSSDIGDTGKRRATKLASVGKSLAALQLFL